MEQTTQSPPSKDARTENEKADAEKPANSTQHLPATEEDFRSGRSRTQSSGFRIGVGIAIIVLLIAGFFAYRYFTSYESTDDAEIDGHINPISARISGHVIKLNVDDNQYVPAGTVLVEIDATDYQVAYDRAKAEYENAQAAALAAGVNVPITGVNTSSQISATEADVSSARAGIQAAKQQFEAAKAQLQEAEANNVKAQKTLAATSSWSKNRKFPSSNSIRLPRRRRPAPQPLQAREPALMQPSSRSRKLRASWFGEAQAIALREYRAPANGDYSRPRFSALAEAQQKKADLDQAALNLQYTKIAAPVNGVVSDRTVEVGQNVSPGQELMKIINLDDVWVTANFKETQLRRMRVGQRVTIEVDANGRTYYGTVNSVAGASGARFSLLPPENATGNYVKVVQRIPVKIVLDPNSNKDHQLRPGESVTPKVWIR